MSPTEFASLVGCTQQAVSKALRRGDIEGATRDADSGYWSIPDDCAWRPVRGRALDASDFPACLSADRPASDHSMRENSRALRWYLDTVNATTEQADEALAWMRKHGAELPQLSDDPAIDWAVRHHPALG